MKANINLTENSENGLASIKKIAILNGLKTDKESLINLSIEISANTINYSDDETFIQLTKYKKTI